MSSTATVLDPNRIAKTWRSRGFTCETWGDVPGHEWVDRINESDELLVVLDGEVEIDLDGETLHPEAGEEVVLPAWHRYTVRSVGETPTRWLLGSWADLAQTD